MLVRFLDRLQIGVLAMGADDRSGHGHDVIDGFGFGALPGRMAHRSPALFFAPSQNPGGGGRGAAFELAAMERVVLRLELLDFPFQFPDATLRLIVLLVEFPELILVVIFPSGRLLITTPDPPGGQAFQIRAPLPVRADKIPGQIGEAGHG